MSKFCSNCGSELNEHDNFCPNCGKKISEPYARHTEQMRDNGIIENFFRRDGRLNRMRYFKRMLLLNFVAFIILIVGFVLIGNPNEERISLFETIWLKIVVLIALIPQFCLMTRRLHDMNNDSILAYVIVALNVLNIITLDYFSSVSPSVFENILGLIQASIGLYILFRRGTKGDNKYGADPLAGQNF